MGFAIAISVVVAMAIAVTLLPGLLGLAGQRIDAWALHRRKVVGAAHATVSGRWAHHVGRRPGRYAIGAFVGLIVLAAPVLALRIGFADDGNAAPGSTPREAYDLTTAAYGPGFNGPLTVVVEGPADGDATVRVHDALAATDGIAFVAPPITNDAGDTSVIVANPTTAPGDEATADLLGEVRDDVLPAAVAGNRASAEVTARPPSPMTCRPASASGCPFSSPPCGACRFVLLMVVFRSVLVPLGRGHERALDRAPPTACVVAIVQWGLARTSAARRDRAGTPFVPLIMLRSSSDCEDIRGVPAVRIRRSGCGRPTPHTSWSTAGARPG